MITGDSDYLEGLVKTHVCPEHGAKLVVAWNNTGNTYCIRCGEGHYPEEITREKVPTQEYKEGTRAAHGTGLDLMIREDLGTGKAISGPQEIMLLKFADRYGLDAYRGHVMLMYGKPYIGIDGYLWHARVGGRPYSLTSAPMTRDQEEQYKVDNLGHNWLATVEMLDTGEKYTGVGIVTPEELTATSKKSPGQLLAPVVAAHPWQLAQKRAEWQAMRRAFPIGYTDNIEEG